MTINVTQAHIDAGIREDCGKCPIALAITEALSVEGVMVGKEWCQWKYNLYGPGSVYKFTYRVRNFVSDFDDGLPVQPFSFELPIAEGE